MVLHDDATREYAYGPARSLPDTKFGTFTAGLDDESKKNSWTFISMKNDWNRGASVRVMAAICFMGRNSGAPAFALYDPPSRH